MTHISVDGMLQDSADLPEIGKREWTDVGRTTADPKPIVQGRMVQGEVRVDEAKLEAGRTYRVEFGGQIVGEVRVTDPVVGVKTNRADRRRKSKGQGVHRRRDLYAARWGRD